MPQQHRRCFLGTTSAIASREFRRMRHLSLQALYRILRTDPKQIGLFACVIDHGTCLTDQYRQSGNRYAQAVLTAIDGYR
nr:hypothetical protein [Rhodococcus sp. JVH1]